MKKYIIPMLILLLIAASASASPVAIEGHAVVTDLPEAILLIVFGCVVGLIGTLIGAGGGFIHVPMLMIFFDFSPQLAIGTSITAVFMNALSGTFSYITHKRIDYEIGLKFATAAVPGVFIGAVVAQHFTFTSFSIFFSITLILLSIHLFAEKDISIVRTKALEQPKERLLVDAEGETHAYAPDMAIGLAGSFFTGIFSGLFGIGGKEQLRILDGHQQGDTPLQALNQNGERRFLVLLGTAQFRAEVSQLSVQRILFQHDNFTAQRADLGVQNR